MVRDEKRTRYMNMFNITALKRLRKTTKNVRTAGVLYDTRNLDL
jgi:hypothetical protein